MKRIRKMVSLQEVAERMVGETAGQELQHSLLQVLPVRIFGETVGARIDEMRIEGNTLRLYISDPVWRRELEKRRLTLLERARTFRSGISRIALSSAPQKKPENA